MPMVVYTEEELIEAQNEAEANGIREGIERTKAEVLRLIGCLLVIAGAEGCGNGSLRTAAFEAASMGATVSELAGKLGSQVPRSQNPRRLHQ